jgi:hypothetical protein
MKQQSLRWDTVSLIHRSYDARVALFRKETPDSLPLGVVTIPARHLHLAKKYPNAFQDPNETDYAFELREDGFFTINSPGCYQVRRGGTYRAKFERFPSRNFYRYTVARKKDYVRYLNACYVDIDCYDKGLTTGEVTGRVDDMVIAGKLPQPSLQVYSGQGVWYLWLLYDEDPKVETGKGSWERWPDGWKRWYEPEQYPPVRAWPDRVRRWEEIQKKLFAMLEPLGADRAVTTDTARIMRLPGSLHRKSGKQVVFQEIGVKDGHILVYSFTGLEQGVGIKRKERSKPRHTQAHTAKDPGNLTGLKRLNALRFDQFEYLREMRGGGFDKGSRRWGALFYAYHLWKNGYADQQIEKRVAEYARQSAPQLAPSMYRQKIEAATVEVLADGTTKRAFWQWKNETLIDQFAITTQESLALYERFRDNAWISDEDKPSRKHDAEERRAAILQILTSENKNYLSLRKMVKALAQRGIKTTRPTVANDYRALGITA